MGNGGCLSLQNLTHLTLVRKRRISPNPHTLNGRFLGWDRRRCIRQGSGTWITLMPSRATSMSYLSGLALLRTPLRFKRRGVRYRLMFAGRHALTARPLTPQLYTSLYNCITNCKLVQLTLQQCN